MLFSVLIPKTPPIFFYHVRFHKGLAYFNQITEIMEFWLFTFILLIYTKYIYFLIQVKIKCKIIMCERLKIFIVTLFSFPQNFFVTFPQINIIGFVSFLTLSSSLLSYWYPIFLDITISVFYTCLRNLSPCKLHLNLQKNSPDATRKN